MKKEDVKYDCRHFEGHIPCKPNKLYDVQCDDCSYYDKVTPRILFIKLGAIGDVIRTTPLLTKYKEKYPNCHFTWITHSPQVLPKEKVDVVYKWDATSLYTIANEQFDIAVNLDKDKEACMLLANVCAK